MVADSEREVVPDDARRVNEQITARVRAGRDFRNGKLRRNPFDEPRFRARRVRDVRRPIATVEITPSRKIVETRPRRPRDDEVFATPDVETVEIAEDVKETVLRVVANRRAENDLRILGLEGKGRRFVDANVVKIGRTVRVEPNRNVYVLVNYPDREPLGTVVTSSR